MTEPFSHTLLSKISSGERIKARIHKKLYAANGVSVFDKASAILRAFCRGHRHDPQDLLQENYTNKLLLLSSVGFCSIGEEKKRSRFSSERTPVSSKW